jgi:1-aminocyclopropane-1-carboxylate deaminase
MIDDKVRIDNIKEDFLQENNIELSILRLDLLHPEISGNKWFKLKYNIEKAMHYGQNTLLSFGGAFSNHLHAMAFASKINNLNSIGIIRGEKPSILSNTLQDCVSLGMRLEFITRDDYKQKDKSFFIKKLKEKFGDFYLIPEGGNNRLGIKGCSEIPSFISEKYDTICLPIGSSATMAGVLVGSQSHQKIIGFSALKGAEYLQDEIINSLLNFELFNTNYSINHEYHFGGFAKHKPELIQFMKQFKAKHNIELDFIYTAKMMFGIYNLIKNGVIKKDSCIIAIHTGGLQGNRSLGNILN